MMVDKTIDVIHSSDFQQTQIFIKILTTERQKQEAKLAVL